MPMPMLSDLAGLRSVPLLGYLVRVIENSKGGSTPEFSICDTPGHKQKSDSHITQSLQIWQFIVVNQPLKDIKHIYSLI